MVSKEEDLQYRIAELVKEAKHILEHAEEVQYHFEQKDLQAACDILALSHYKVSSYVGCRKSLLEVLEKDGYTPGKRN